MMCAKIPYNTKHIKHNGEILCAYCCNKIEPDIEVDGYDSWDYYHCNCEDALKEIEIHNEIIKLEKEIEKYKSFIPKAKYKLVTETTLKNIC